MLKTTNFAKSVILVVKNVMEKAKITALNVSLNLNLHQKGFAKFVLTNISLKREIFASLVI